MNKAFKVGQKVQYGEFVGYIVEHSHDTMWNVRLDGGMICVGEQSLKAI